MRFVSSGLFNIRGVLRDFLNKHTIKLLKRRKVSGELLCFRPAVNFISFDLPAARFVPGASVTVKTKHTCELMKSYQSSLNLFQL